MAHAQARAPSSAAPAAWERYFSEEATDTDRRVLLIRELTSFFASNEGWPLLCGITRVNGVHALALDYAELESLTNSQDLIAAVEHQPEEGLACLAIAAQEVLTVQSKATLKEVLGQHSAPDKINIRLTNYAKASTAIRAIKSSLIGSLISVKGTVVRMTGVRPLITQMAFHCTRCGCTITCRFSDGKYAPPQRCSGEGCRSKSFAPDRSSAGSIDWQKLRIQELARADGGSAGAVPRTVEVEVREDLVDACAAGDVVTVVGFVRVVSTDTAAGGNKGKAEKCLFLLYLEAVSVEATRRAAKPVPSRTPLKDARGQAPPAGADQDTPPNVAAFTLRSLQFVVDFSARLQGEQFRHLVHALCPTIFGHEMVKAGLVLALLGGVRKGTGCPDSVPVRGDIHVLMCGDPGLGKSQLLQTQAAAAVAPRGLYVCGSAASAAGLTVAVAKDALSGEPALEAGALVLADRGTCCIDEFDKMAADHKVLLGVMEQQEVAVAKAGLSATLPARASILAAANPAGGSYTRAKTVAENLKMSAAMLSRFDLVFLMLDRPDHALDKCLTEHVLALHSGEAARAKAAQQRMRDARPVPLASQPLGAGAGVSGEEPRVGLEQSLCQYSKRDADPVPPQLMRTYFAYARAHVHPRLSQAAKEVLREFYLELRSRASTVDGAPITTRQLESLVRLGEARARAELREMVTRGDAQDVVDLMRLCLLDSLADAAGPADLRRGAARSKQARAAGRRALGEALRFLGALTRRCERAGSDLVSVAQLYALADELELNVPDLEAFLARLNDAGELLKKPGRMFQVAGLGLSMSQASQPPSIDGGTSSAARLPSGHASQGPSQGRAWGKCSHAFL